MKSPAKSRPLRRFPLFPSNGDAANVDFWRHNLDAEIRMAVLRILERPVPDVEGGRFPLFRAVQAHVRLGPGKTGLKGEASPACTAIFDFNPHALHVLGLLFEGRIEREIEKSDLPWSSGSLR